MTEKPFTIAPFRVLIEGSDHDFCEYLVSHEKVLYDKRYDKYFEYCEENKDDPGVEVRTVLVGR